jgi:hypothetical protein
VNFKTILFCAITFSLGLINTSAQRASETPAETRVSLTQAAVALDAQGTPALEGTLRTTSLNGAADMPLTNIAVLIKNVSPVFFSYVSGVITFYDSSGVRCGEGLFKTDALAVGETVETDSPGIRIRCSAANWRLVATSLIPRNPAPTTISASSTANLIISLDGEEHPIQLEKPMVVNIGERRRTIIVRRAP